MKFGIFTVSMPDYEPIAALEKAAALGYDGLKWRVVEDKGDRNKPLFWSGNRTSMTATELIARAPELKAKAMALGLAMPSLGTYIDASNLDAVRLSMEAARAVGAKCLRISAGGYDPAKGGYRELVSKARVQYAKVAALAKEHGVRAVIETHHGQLAPSVGKAMMILDGLDPAQVGIMWDPANQVYEGLENYRMAIELAGPYLAEVHVKNAKYVLDGLKWKATWAPVNAGIVDWPAVMEELQRAGYQDWVIFEDFSTELPLDERLAFNLSYFKKLVEPTGGTCR